MRIIILTQYYPPETGAPQNRLHALAKAAKSAGHEVEVITAMPHYPVMKVHENYRRKWGFSEEVDGIQVHRSWIYATRSKSLIPRLLSYFSFVFSSMFVGARRLSNADVLIVESPPLFLAYSAFRLARKKKAKLVANISDLWPESAVALGLVTNSTFIKMATSLENKLYQKSSLISCQTQGITQHIQSRFPKKQTFWFPNGADTDQFDPNTKSKLWRERLELNPEAQIFSYAGIHGHAQGLQVVVEAANLLKAETNVHFVLVGSGPEKDELLEQATGLSNVHFWGNVPREEIKLLLADSYATVVPLKKSPLFEGAIPSKIFESLAMEVPVILGVEGEARKIFIDQGQSGLFFEPENAEALAERVLDLSGDETKHRTLSENAGLFVRQNYDRTKVNMNFLRELDALD